MKKTNSEIPKIIKVDFDWDIKNMRGDKVGRAANTLAHILETHKISGINAEKATDWAELLYENKPLNMDRADYKALKKWTTDENNQVLLPIALRRFQEFFNDEKSQLTD